MYRQAVVLPTPNPAASSANDSPFAQAGQHEQGLLPGVQLPPARPDRLQMPPDEPGCVAKGLAVQRQRGTVE
jgi:hypothetical protein